MELAIVTGVSSGLGDALWLQAQKEGMATLGISRRGGSVVSSMAKSLQLNVSDTSDWELVIEKALEAWPQKWSRIYVIMAAGQLGPVCSLEQMPWRELEYLYRVNVIAPLRLASWALQRFKEPTQELRIAPISSGAARKVYEGWTAYCGTKAALRMSTEIAASEAAKEGRRVSYVSYSPGVIDTPMQALVRESEEDVFPSLSRFRELYETGQPVPATESARILWKLLRTPELPVYLEYRHGDPCHSLKFK